MCPYIYLILPSYQILAFIGGIVVLIFVYFRIEKYGMAFTDYIKLFVLCICGCVAGSKLLYAVTQIPWLIQNFTLSNFLVLIPQSGYVYYGGLFGMLATIWFYAGKSSKYEFDKICCMITPAIPLFHGFGRIGCLLSGCCYGKILEPPIVFFHTVQMNRIPTQIIEAVFEFCLFVVILILEKKKLRYNLLKIYLLSYAMFRFINEFFRGDEIRGIYFGLSTAQWISMLIVLYYIVKVWKYRKNKVDADKGAVL